MIYECRLSIQQSDASYDVDFAVSSGGSWRVRQPEGWCPMNGPWDASDLVGRGGCVCFGGGSKRPPIFRLNEFKPYGYEKYKEGTVGPGTGVWLEPAMPVDKGREFPWRILAVKESGLFEFGDTSEEL